MLLYRVDIKFGFGQLGFNIYPGDVKIKTDIINQFNIEKKEPELDNKASLPQITIDSSQCWMEIGYFPPQELAVNFFEDAKNSTLDYIEKKAVEGDMLGAIEKGIQIQDLALSEVFTEKDFNIDFVPKSRPKIRATSAELSFNYRPGHVNVDVGRFPVKFNHYRAAVKAYLEKKPFIDINVVKSGERIDIKL